jgi:hypothetical protein
MLLHAEHPVLSPLRCGARPTWGGLVASHRNIHQIIQESMKPTTSLALTGLALGAACYTYPLATPGPLAAGSTVRVTLTDPGTASVASLVGPYAERIEGVVAASDDNSLTLGVRELVRRSGIEETWKGERVRLHVGDIGRIELRTFSRSSTALLAAGLVGGGLLAARGFTSGGSVATPPVTPPPTGK